MRITLTHHDGRTHSTRNLTAIDVGQLHDMAVQVLHSSDDLTPRRREPPQ